VAGEAAVLVDPRDSTALTEAIDRVLDDAALAEGLAAAGPARAAIFTWEATAARTAAIYAELATGRTVAGGGDQGGGRGRWT